MPKTILLASKSPRRQQLLAALGLDFRIVHQDIEEHYPSDLDVRQVPIYLAQQKARAVQDQLQAPHEIILASDTIVLLDGQIYGKPSDAQDAHRILSALSGQTHEVITGVCLLSQAGERCFSDTAKVKIDPLSSEEINFYVQRYQPYDKAGAYAVQEWIGLAKISRMEGSYFTIMGLPTHLIYQALQD
jgi:septum formation protein